MENSTSSLEMELVSAVKIPIFNPSDPALWFRMCESTFELATPKPITVSKTKFNYIVAHIPPETASLVRDVIVNPDPEDPYKNLREELTKRSGESSQAEIRRLLAGEQLGDRCPSELLRVMQRRAESHALPDKVLLELFLQQMPSHVQSILAAIDTLSIAKAAEIADRIIEVSPAPVSQISKNNENLSDYQKLLTEVKKLHERLNSLVHNRGRSREKRSRTRSQSRDVICWYHKKFGFKARKCAAPCTYSKNEEGSA